jgi:hypothetical protein
MAMKKGEIMKFLLAIAMTMVLTGTAFGACSTTSLKECTNESDCKKLSKDGGSQFVFENTMSEGSQCRLKEPTVATDCTQAVTSGRAAKGDSPTSDTGAGATSATQQK